MSEENIQDNEELGSEKTNTDNAPTNNDNSLETGIKAAAVLANKVPPLYEDAFQPAAKELGKTLEITTRAVNAALSPVKGLVWGIEELNDFINNKLAEKLHNVPEENIQTPDPAVAGPALESLRYTGHKEELSDLYASLIASAMDAKTAHTAHPGFVEIIRNLSSDEVKVFETIIANQVYPIIDIKKILPDNGGESVVHPLMSTLGEDANCDIKEMTPSYLINLERLGLIEIVRNTFLTREGAYDKILNDQSVTKHVQMLEAVSNFLHGGELKFDYNKHFTAPTPFGKLFYNACKRTVKIRAEVSTDEQQPDTENID